MPFSDKFPHLKSCCGCITDFTTASAIIAVLAIATNPVLSWLTTRHTYSMRVSCYVSTMSRMDVVDLNINNIVSFGFGVNSAVGNSCLTEGNPQQENTGQVRMGNARAGFGTEHGKNITRKSMETSGRSEDNPSQEVIANAAGTTSTIDVVKALGWMVLVGDIIWLITSIAFLVNLYQNPVHRLVLAFMISAGTVVVISTVYGILYVVVCEFRGKGLALCELVLCIFDMSLWAYFLLVVNCYRRNNFTETAPRARAQ